MTRTAPPSARAGQGGFTLIEILAVIMLTGFVMYAIYRVLFSTLQAQDVVEENVTVYEVGPRIVELVAADLQSVSVGLIADQKGLKGGMENVGGVETSFVDFVTSSDSRMVLTPEKPIQSDLSEIGYSCRVSDAYPGLIELFRREDWGVDDQPLEGDLYFKVYDKVKEFRLEYIERGKEDAETYDDTWDTSTKKVLPRAVLLKLTIVVGDPRELADDEGVYTFERVILIPGGEDTAESTGPPPGGPGR